MKIGDKVSVIDDNLKGTITAINGDTITLKDEHGFQYHYHRKYLVVVVEDLYQDIIPSKKKEYIPPKSQKSKNKHLTLDLHFDKLVEHPDKYDSVDRLFIQKEKLMETIEFCETNHIPKLEIIHGIGSGTLQKMVYEVLESKGNVEFDNSDFFYHQSGTIMVSFVKSKIF